MAKERKGPFDGSTEEPEKKAEAPAAPANVPPTAPQSVTPAPALIPEAPMPAPAPAPVPEPTPQAPPAPQPTDTASAEPLAPLAPPAALPDVHQHSEKARKPKPPPLRRALKMLRTVGLKTYAAAILFLLCLAGYLAVVYLMQMIFRPPPVPARLLEWQAKLDPSALRETQGGQAAGISKAAPRAPLSHYHGVDQWFQPDTLNGCTLSGCHDPLPHAQKAKVPAFANFHTTFLRCEMCHVAAQQHPTAAAWINTQTATGQGAPAILQLLKYLELNQQAISEEPAKAHALVLPLLRETSRVLGGDSLLDEILAQIETSEPGSPVWKRAMVDLADELPLHARGEYLAKVVWQSSADQSKQRFQELRRLAKEYLASQDGPQRRKLTEQIHAPLQKSPPGCLSCHGDQPPLLDFGQLGYSPNRTRFLSNLEVARLMQQVRQGERFFIPRLLDSKE